MAGFLTTHVLDTARGRPAAGVAITLDRLEGGDSGGPRPGREPGRVRIAEAVTNADGRTEAPLLPETAFALGTYELVFAAGDYLRATGQAGADALFLDQIPIRFAMTEATHYHVPLLLSPFGYSTYRGS